MLKLVLNYKLVAFDELLRTQRAIGFLCAVIKVIGYILCNFSMFSKFAILYSIDIVGLLNFI